MKNFLNKPWTWGTYLKLCAVSLLISIGATALWLWRIYRK